MAELLKKLYFPKSYKMLLIPAGISLLVGIFAGVISLFWHFWLIFGVFLYIILIVYFSKEFRDLLNIHVVALSLIILHAAPSTILILQGEIQLNNHESLMLFSAIAIGLIGYTIGALFLRKLFSFEKKENTLLSRKINALFWLTYKYRKMLAFISGIVLFFRGFMPMAMPYVASIIYRLETPGIIRYFNSLIALVFSVLVITMVSIVGDIKKYKKLSWLSYLLIILTLFAIVGGHRIWIIALFACLMLAFQPFLKRKHILTIVILAVIMIFIISGGVRYARVGDSFAEQLKYFYEYFLNIRNMSFADLMWGFSDFVVPFSTFVTIVQNVPQNINFNFLAPVDDISLWIPTIVFPERPLPVAQWYVKTFEPEIFAAGGGLTFFVIGFGYLFAGPIGVFIYLFLFGALFEWLGKFFKMIGGAAGLFLYSYFFIQLFTFVRGGEFFSFIRSALVLWLFIPLSLLFLFVLVLDSLKLKRS